MKKGGAGGGSYGIFFIFLKLMYKRWLRVGEGRKISAEIEEVLLAPTRIGGRFHCPVRGEGKRGLAARFLFVTSDLTAASGR
jgi:hypothetical protein